MAIIESDNNEPYTAHKSIKTNTFAFDSPITNQMKENLQIEAAIILLRGKIYRNLGNHEVATQCFKDVLHMDVYCYEAFNLLVGQHALKAHEEMELINKLPYKQQCTNEEQVSLVRYAYETKVNHHGKHKVIYVLPFY